MSDKFFKNVEPSQGYTSKRRKMGSLLPLSPMKPLKWLKKQLTN